MELDRRSEEWEKMLGGLKSKGVCFRVWEVIRNKKTGD